jgi:hypothetical protein
MSDWIQSNWFELGSLMVQFAVLVTLAWFGRKLLRILSVSFGHSEALPRVSPSNVAVEQRVVEQEYAPPAFQPARQALARESRTWPGLIEWLREPIGNGGTYSRNRFIRWFQAPIGS